MALFLLALSFYLGMVTACSHLCYIHPQDGVWRLNQILLAAWIIFSLKPMRDAMAYHRRVRESYMDADDDE